MKTQISVKNTLIYLLGMLTIAFGVLFMLRSDIGSSSWDSLHFALHKLLPITIGNAMIMVAVFFTILVVYFNRSFKYLVMLVPIFSVGYIFDFIDLVIMVNFNVSTLFTQILSFTLGLLMLPLGGSLLIISTYPAGVFDEFMISMMKVFKTNKMVLIRVIMEMSAVTVAFLIQLYVGFDDGQIGLGTLIFSLTVGMSVKLYLRLFTMLNMFNDETLN